MLWFCSITSAERNEITLIKLGKLELKMMNYFLLIAMAAVLIGVEFYFELSSDAYIEEFHQSLTISDETAAMQHIEQNIADLRNKIVIMFGVLSFVAAIVMLMFIKNITIPLAKMIAISKCINSGDLSHFVEIDEKDEIGELGQAINELTSNLQELALLTSSTCERIDGTIAELIEKVEPEKEETRTTLEELRNETSMLNNFVSMFKLLMPK